VYKALRSTGFPLSPGEALRRVFEVVASGVLLPNCHGLRDPCERGQVDAAQELTLQQREDITGSAQLGLRLISYGRAHEVLGMERMRKREPKARAPITTEAKVDGSGAKLTDEVSAKAATGEESSSSSSEDD